MTHHHGDHVGGLTALRPRLTGEVIGPSRESIMGLDRTVSEGDRVDALGLEFEVLDVPGHTRGHIAFFSGGAKTSSALGHPVVFCGDTLFSGGCGRLFEGTPAQMHASLERLATLPGDTAVCCAHEYTLSNLRFARAVEPHNAQLSNYRIWCEEQRARALPTLPGRIATEREVNPFLRCSEPDVIAAARSRDASATTPIEVLASLREWKNEFR